MQKRIRMVSRRTVMLGAPLACAGMLRGANEAVSEFIFDSAPFPSCYASTVVELSNGDLMSAWFGGAGEVRPDVALWGATRTTSGGRAPRDPVREPNVPNWNHVLIHTNHDTLQLYSNYCRSPDT